MNLLSGGINSLSIATLYQCVSSDIRSGIYVCVCMREREKETSSYLILLCVCKWLYKLLFTCSTINQKLRRIGSFFFFFLVDRDFHLIKSHPSSVGKLIKL